MIPASTSPEPAVASQGGAEALIAARPSGAAMMVSAPFSSTHATGARRGRTRGGKPIGAGRAECAGELAGMRRHHRGTAQRVRARRQTR